MNTNESVMTYRDICLRFAEFKGIPELEREAWALAWWNASPTGELWHVYAAWDQMVEAGFLHDR